MSLIFYNSKIFKRPDRLLLLLFYTTTWVCLLLFGFIQPLFSQTDSISAKKLKKGISLGVGGAKGAYGYILTAGTLLKEKHNVALGYIFSNNMGDINNQKWGVISSYHFFPFAQNRSIFFHFEYNLMVSRHENVQRFNPKILVNEFWSQVYAVDNTIAYGVNLNFLPEQNSAKIFMGICLGSGMVNYFYKNADGKSKNKNQLDFLAKFFLSFYF